MHARFTWILLSVTIAVGAGCQDSRQRAATLPVAVEDRPTDSDLVREALAARRATAIAQLRNYREAALYPVDDAGLPVGVFRDAHGVRCPMSELIFQSGRGDLVDAVVRTNNRIKLADVHDGPLMAWMLHSGFTQEEIVEVQGAMDWNQGNFQIQNEELDHLMLVEVARQTVDGKLVNAETMLRSKTASSLTIAAARLSDAEKAALIAERRSIPARTRTASRN